MSTPQRVAIEPRLVARESAFVASFYSDVEEHAVRRVWPGQPSARSPWRSSSGGRYLVLDAVAAAADPGTVAPWLRFLIQQFLAPSTAVALDVALDSGLRGGHAVNGSVVVAGTRLVVVRANRVTEEAARMGAEVLHLRPAETPTA